MGIGVKAFLRSFIERGTHTVSYAQAGEDLILALLFRILKIEKPRYLDLGAHHPTYLSNTYFFYRVGSQGVCVEPDPVLCQNIKRKRPQDICLNVGVTATETQKMDFYVMSARSLSTFSRDIAETYASYGQQKIEKILSIDCIPINTLVRQYFSAGLDFVSLDIEGKDLEILQALDFSMIRPKVFCLETLTYTENHSEEKITSIIDFMVEKDYMVFADTYINTIFVDKQVWDRRQ
jgi:FkbM family methyltransferase